MCTASWLYGAEGFQVFFNRDEKKTRGHARPPEVSMAGETACLFPTDPDGGGTWIGVNQYGLVLAVLNNYQADANHESSFSRSRGVLVRNLLSCSSGPAVRAAIENEAYQECRPFLLLVFTRGGAVELASWNGRNLAWSEPREQVLTTSGYRPDEVAGKRLALYRELVGREGMTPSTLEVFHRSRDPADGAGSVCMTRDDAATVSMTRIVVTPGEAVLRYLDGPPGTNSPEYTSRLPLEPMNP